MKAPRILRAALLMAAALLLPGAASAQTCSFTISDLNFGAIDTLSAAPADFSANLTYDCSGTASDRILICPHLHEGSVASVSGGVRRMASGTGYLNYQLYQNIGRSVEWGAFGWMFLPPPIEVILNGGGTAAGSVPIYGRAFGSQTTVPPALDFAASFSGASVEIRYRSTPSDSICTNQAGTLAAAPSFNVTASVDPNCRIATSPVNFGTQGVLRSNVDATGEIAVTCTPSTNYGIELNGGTTGSPPTQRKMSKAAETVTYGLYKNSGRDQPWGDSSSPGSTVTGNGSGLEQSHTVYGRVPPQTTPSPGIYTDTVIVTVTY